MSNDDALHSAPSNVQSAMDPRVLKDPRGMTLAGWAFQGRVITLGLVAGCVFVGVILGVIGGDNAPEGDMTLMVLIGVAALVLNIVMAFLVPAMLRSTSVAKLKAADGAAASARTWSQWPEREPMPMALSEFLKTDQIARLIGQAMLEGAAMINFVMMFLTRSPVNLMCAVVALVGIVAMFPTVGRMRDRIESVLRA
ncbi:MAG: hypothetical protein ACF8AM_12495 [Rhodopirellula sp. JB055]|uniref:hypothetical protein n=1 Tax=Rhodopirellula sp. JB055 TaxID=3342846 RepID=UPI00370A6C17